MMKYIFCILLGIFLSWGFQLISDERQEAYRPETGSTYIQTCVNAFHPETKTMIKQLGKEKKLVKAKENTGKQAAGLQRCAKEICHALHDAHLAARMPRHS